MLKNNRLLQLCISWQPHTWHLSAYRRKQRCMVNLTQGSDQVCEGHAECSAVCLHLTAKHVEAKLHPTRQYIRWSIADS